MIINHNMLAANAARMEGVANGYLRGSMEKLSSGERINRAADDASGLSISEKMRAQIRGLNKASQNVIDGNSFLQTAEGYLQSTTSLLQRIRELAVQASNSVYTDEDRAAINVEVSQLVMEIDRIASAAEFNGLKMLTGRYSAQNGAPMSLMVGANMDQQFTVALEDASASALGLKNDTGTVVSLQDTESANRAIGTLDEALKSVNRQRAVIGASMNRMEIAKNAINIAAENLQASESKIRDTDFAAEVVQNTKNQILVNSATAAIAQANSMAQNVLTLLK